MDPLTHALAGAAAGRVSAHRLGRSALLPGAVGALVPDLDGLIRSAADPLLYAEFHRHFTHSLAFIPFGGALASVPWLVRFEARRHWKRYVAAATAGFATHGVLDASTTYGTLLLWPFTDERIALNWISIVDPLFTLVLAVGVGLAVTRQSARAAGLALLVCLAYLAAGAVQHGRALEAQAGLAASRGHAYDRGDVFPGFGNNIIWRSLYRSGDLLYMDRLRVPWVGPVTWKEGPSVPRFEEGDLPPEVRADARLRRDFQRFRWFSSGWLAASSEVPDIIGDARYSASSERFEPVWGIRFTPASTSRRVEWIDRSRQRRIDLGALWAELRGEAGYRPVSGQRWRPPPSARPDARDR